MKVQRILTATIRNEKNTEIYFQIVLAFTDRKEFVVWDYQDENKYFNGSYWPIFNHAYNEFCNRCLIHGDTVYNSIEYYARQIGQAEIVWEDLG